MGKEADWDTVLATLDLLDWEIGARFADSQGMRVWVDGRRYVVHVFARVSQQSGESRGSELTHLTRPRQTVSIGLRKVKILRCISGGTPRKGMVLVNCLHASSGPG